VCAISGVTYARAFPARAGGGTAIAATAASSRTSTAEGR
jgi:hypothetical protein